jgi:uncharacterized protein YcbX
VEESELKECTCWDWKGLAQDEGDEAAAWLSDFLGKPVRLVRYIGELFQTMRAYGKSGVS